MNQEQEDRLATALQEFRDASHEVTLLLQVERDFTAKVLDRLPGLAERGEQACRRIRQLLEVVT